MMYTYLSHHGIAGQKWGKRNGPPYPLGIADHSASERKAGWQKSLDKGKTTSNTTKQAGLSDDAVSLIVQASVFVGVMTGVKASQIVKNKRLVNKGKKLVEQFEKENASDNKSPKSIDSKDINPLKGIENCGACCMAEEMRLRGISTAAKTINGMTIEKMADYFKGASEKSFDKLSADCISKTGNGKETRDNLAAELTKKYPEGSRGCMYIPMWFGNHYITWEVKNGTANFKNPQDTNFDLTQCFSAMVSSGTPGADLVGIRSIRWDNLEFRNDSVGEVLYTDQSSVNKKYHDQYI